MTSSWISIHEVDLWCPRSRFGVGRVVSWWNRSRWGRRSSVSRSWSVSRGISSRRWFVRWWICIWRIGFSDLRYPWPDARWCLSTLFGRSRSPGFSCSKCVSLAPMICCLVWFCPVLLWWQLNRFSALQHHLPDSFSWGWDDRCWTACQEHLVWCSPDREWLQSISCSSLRFLHGPSCSVLSTHWIHLWCCCVCHSHLGIVSSNPRWRYPSGGVLFGDDRAPHVRSGIQILIEQHVVGMRLILCGDHRWLFHVRQWMLERRTLFGIIGWFLGSIYWWWWKYLKEIVRLLCIWLSTVIKNFI